VASANFTEPVIYHVVQIDIR